MCCLPHTPGLRLVREVLPHSPGLWGTCTPGWESLILIQLATSNNVWCVCVCLTWGQFDLQSGTNQGHQGGGEVDSVVVSDGHVHFDEALKRGDEWWQRDVRSLRNRKIAQWKHTRHLEKSICVRTGRTRNVLHFFIDYMQVWLYW